MRIFLDEGVSPSVKSRLVAEGHEVDHVYDLGLAGSPDHNNIVFCREHSYDVIATLDKRDYGRIMAEQGLDRPSVVMMRSKSDINAEQQGQAISDALSSHEKRLANGAIVTTKVDNNNTTRVRQFPLQRSRENENETNRLRDSNTRDDEDQAPTKDDVMTLAVQRFGERERQRQEEREERLKRGRERNSDDG